MVRAPDLKSGDPEMESLSDHLVDLFQAALDSTPQVDLYMANWSVLPASWYS